MKTAKQKSARNVNKKSDQRKMLSKIGKYEIERIKNILQDSTLRDIERYSLNVYLKSLLNDDKK